MSDEGYTINWHDLGSSDDYETFLRWAIVNLTVDQRDVDAGRPNTELLDKLKEVTNGFTDVTLAVQINGIEVDPEHFMRGVKFNLQRVARETVRHQLNTLTAFTDLRNTLTTLEAAANRRVRQVASALNVELDDDEDDE